MKMKSRLFTLLFAVLAALSIQAASASTPEWTFKPLTSTTQSVPANSSTTLMYLVTNQSERSHTLIMQPISGITQVTLGTGVCSNPFTLNHRGDTCILSLQVLGYDLERPVHDGPIVCQQSTTPQCYRPSAANIINVSKSQPIPLPANCIDTGDNNIQCDFPDTQNPTYYGFTNMSYALCRSAQCPYQSGDSTVECSCKLIQENQGLYSASISPLDYNSSKPSGTTVVSTYSMVDSVGEVPTNCASGPFANCFGASCTVSGTSVTCTCPVETDTFIAPEPNCNLGSNLIWSATSVSSFPGIESSMLFMYDTFFGGKTPN